MPDDLALQPPPIVTEPGEKYATRPFQGIPGIAEAPGGRLWTTWYAGGKGEGPENYVLLVTSADGGATWSGPVLAVDPRENVRAFDPCLWRDPAGRLWLFWAQAEDWWDGRGGVWCIRTNESDAERPLWSAPRRIANGVMMNKPTVRANGEWLFPTAVWSHDVPHRSELAAEQRANVLVSTDGGATFSLSGGTDWPDRSFHEHMVIETAGGALRMFGRTRDGIAQATSSDGGRTWEAGGIFRRGPSTRFFMGKLASGALLLVYHDHPAKRTNLAAWLSRDDGATWRGPLLLDDRDGVSYPDGVACADGFLRVVYDRERSGAREILFATFREEDVEAGRIVSPGARLRGLVNRAE